MTRSQQSAPTTHHVIVDGPSLTEIARFIDDWEIKTYAFSMRRAVSFQNSTRVTYFSFQKRDEALDVSEIRGLQWQGGVDPRRVLVLVGTAGLGGDLGHFRAVYDVQKRKGEAWFQRSYDGNQFIGSSFSLDEAPSQ